jgi:hypothetical protein
MENNTVTSPDKKQVIFFGEMLEQAMGGAYYCPIFLKNEKDEKAPNPYLLHERSTGNAVWNDNKTVFFPIWTTLKATGLMQQIAFYDVEKGQISVFEKVYNFVEITSVKGFLIQAIHSPHWQPNDIVINIKTEKIEKTISWTKTDSDIVAIKQRLHLATGGHWFYFLEGRDHTAGSSFIMTNVENREDWRNPNRGEDLEIIGATQADMEFIAHARQDIPMLLAEIERLKNPIKN